MRRTVVIFFSFIVLLGALGVVGWWYYENYVKNVKTEDQELIEIPDWYHTDKDGDGISDEQEKELGIDPIASDSDGDSIPDKTEIDVYKTDPKNRDTDGDGFPDGFELLRGYNPLEKAPINQ